MENDDDLSDKQQEIVLIPVVRDPVQEYDLHFKILMLGATGVGKTAILNYHVHDIHCDEKYRKPSCPETVSVSHTISHGKKVHYMILDEPATLHRLGPRSSSYKMSNGFVIVYDVTSKQSWFHIKEVLENIDRCGPPNFVCKIIIGNKVEKDSHRDVPFQDVYKFVTESKIPYFETSALTGQNIVEAFGYLLNDLVEESINYKPPRGPTSVTVRLK